MYSILISCEWKCEYESCESIMPKSPTKRLRRRDSPITKEQEIWIVKRSALMTPTQLRRSFINQFLDPEILTIWHPDLSLLQAQTIPQEMISKSTANLRKRCEACLIESGGHVEATLKSM